MLPVTSFMDVTWDFCDPDLPWQGLAWCCCVCVGTCLSPTKAAALPLPWTQWLGNLCTAVCSAGQPEDPWGPCQIPWSCQLRYIRDLAVGDWIIHVLLPVYDIGVEACLPPPLQLCSLLDAVG